MTISGIGGGFSTPLMTSSVQDRPQKLLQQMDTDVDGKVSKQEFVAFGDKMKANAPKRLGDAAGPQGANAPSPPSADEMFAKADSDGDGSLSIENLSAMMSEHETHAAARGGQGHGGPPPGGAPPGGAPPGGAPPGGAPPGGAPPGGTPPGGARHDGKHAGGTENASSSTSSKSSSSDPADTDHDGTVSAAEKLVYQFSHPNVSDAEAS